MQSALTPSADSAARDYYAREKYRSRLCLGGVSLGLAVLGCCAALLPGFQSAAGTLGIALVCAGLLALLCRRQLRADQFQIRNLFGSYGERNFVRNRVI